MHSGNPSSPVRRSTRSRPLLVRTRVRYNCETASANCCWASSAVRVAPCTSAHARARMRGVTREVQVDPGYALEEEMFGDRSIPRAVVIGWRRQFQESCIQLTVPVAAQMATRAAEMQPGADRGCSVSAPPISESSGRAFASASISCNASAVSRSGSSMVAILSVPGKLPASWGVDPFASRTSVTVAGSCPDSFVELGDGTITSLIAACGSGADADAGDSSTSIASGAAGGIDWGVPVGAKIGRPVQSRERIERARSAWHPATGAPRCWASLTF